MKRKPPPQAKTASETVTISDALRRAVDLHRAGQLDAAFEIYQKILAAAPEQPDALHLSGLVLRARGDIAGSIALISRAIPLMSEPADAINNLCNSLLAAGRYDEVARAAARVLALRPNDPTARCNLGLAHLNRGDWAVAAEIFTPLTQEHPSRGDYFGHLGNCLRRLGRHVDSLAAFDQALALTGQPDWMLMRAMALQSLERNPEAEAAYLAALAHNPVNAIALNNLGNIYATSARWREAPAYYRRALAVKPDLAEAWNNLGYIHEKLGEIGEAATCYEKACAVRPDYAEAWSNLGNIRQAQGRWHDAVPLYDKAVAAEPDNPRPYNNRGNALMMLSRLVDAAESMRKAIEIKPDYHDAWSNLGNVYQCMGRMDLAIPCFRKAMELAPDYIEANSNLIFSLGFSDQFGQEEHQAERRAWYQRHGAKFASSIRPHANDPDPERVLRVGYVSADLRGHPASYVFAPILLGHDPAQVSWYCYSQTVREDDLTREFRAKAARFERIIPSTDDEVADMIRADRIDILVDMSGHSGGNRLLVFARKPAPIQCSAWGHAMGTGLPTIDYLFADPVTVPPEDRHLFAETIIDLPGVMSYQRPAEQVEIGALPLFTRGYPMLGSLNRLAKVGEPVMQLWAELMHRLPGSKILFKDRLLNDPPQRERVMQTMARFGIDAGRILLMAQTDRAGHLAAYNQIDLHLDPFPQGGGMTTLEACWMGVPSLTLIGRIIPGRFSAAINATLGLDAFTATDRDDFLAKGVAALAKPAGLAALRSELRTRLMTSPIGDCDRYRQSVERIYRDLWRRWCARQHA